VHSYFSAFVFALLYFAEEFRSPDDKTKETKDELDQDILENGSLFL